MIIELLVGATMEKELLASVLSCLSHAELAGVRLMKV